MPELNLSEISHRAVSGVMVLTARKFVLKGVNYLGSIFLARLLAPEIFGVFAIISFIITFFSFFSDIGLGASLIQKKEKLTRQDLAVTFTLQQMLVLAVTLIIWLTAPIFSGKYNLGVQGIWLLRVFSLSLFLTSLKTIPSILLERRLNFNRLIWPEAVEVVSFQVLAIALALQGYGVWSFIVALLVRSLLGAIALFWLSPWPVGFAWDKTITRRLVSFGIPYNLNGFIATIKDAVMPVFVGAVSGASAVGYLNWALTFSKLPILFMADIFRVTFPAYARIQDNPAVLKKAIEKTIRFTNLFLFPAALLLAALARPIITIIFTDKWLPALPAFYIHLTGIIIVGITNTFMDALWALGKTKIAIKLLLIYTLVNWGASVPLVYLFGFNGAMIGSVIVLYISLPLTWFYIRKIVKVEVIRHLWPAFTASILAGLFAYRLNFLAINLISLVFVGLTAGIVYLLLLLLLDRRHLLADLAWVWGIIRH